MKSVYSLLFLLYYPWLNYMPVVFFKKIYVFCYGHQSLHWSWMKGNKSSDSQGKNMMANFIQKFKYLLLSMIVIFILLVLKQTRLIVMEYREQFLKRNCRFVHEEMAKRVNKERKDKLRVNIHSKIVSWLVRRNQIAFLFK